MTALTIKERAGIKAALATLHASGHDTAAVQQQAMAANAAGMPAYDAYKAVLGAFVKANPDMAPVLLHTDRLIDASDDATVARYDAAIGEYLRTGDESHVNALEATVRADSIALAVRDGKLSAEDAEAGRVDWGGMGFAAPAPAAAVPAQFSLPRSTPPSTPPTAGQAANSPASQPSTGGRHFGFTGGGTGVRSAKSEAKFGASPHPVMSRPSPYAGLSPAQIKDAMRADFAAPRGWTDRPAETA